MFEVLKYSLYTMEAVAAVTAFIYAKKWAGTSWKWFPYYLAAIVAGEMTGTYFTLMKMYDANFILYMDIIMPGEFLFFFWVFYLDLQKTTLKWLPITCAVSYLACFVSDVIYFRNVQFVAFSFSYTVGNILLLILILNFFLRLTNSAQLLKFRENMLFWVSIGLLIYYLGSCPYYGLRNVLVYRHRTLNTYYSVFVYILDCAMYLTFSVGFICGKPRS